MAFVKNWRPKVGEQVITTKKFENCLGYMEKGTLVTIIGLSERGYDIEDNEGNRVIECGWTGFKQVK